MYNEWTVYLPHIGIRESCKNCGLNTWREDKTYKTWKKMREYYWNGFEGNATCCVGWFLLVQARDLCCVWTRLRTFESLKHRHLLTRWASASCSRRSLLHVNCYKLIECIIIAFEGTDFWNASSPQLSQYSVWLQTGRPGFDRRQRQRHFPLTSVSRPVLKPTQSPIQLVPEVLSLGVKGGRAWSWPLTPV
jgi:hypothetical protein